MVLIHQLRLNNNQGVVINRSRIECRDDAVERRGQTAKQHTHLCVLIQVRTERVNDQHQVLLKVIILRKIGCTKLFKKTYRDGSVSLRVVAVKRIEYITGMRFPLHQRHLAVLQQQSTARLG